MKHYKAMGIILGFIFLLLVPFQALAQPFSPSPHNQPVFIPENSTVKMSLYGEVMLGLQEPWER